MKRNKKQDKAEPGQLHLFETPPLRQQQKEKRTKPKKKPVEALKTARLTLVPPPPVEALKQEKNALKTEISNGRELNHLWRANPQALHTLNQMAKKNPAVLTLVRRFALVPLCLMLFFSCGRSSLSGNSPKEADPATPTIEQEDPAAPTIEQAVSFLALAEGWHDPKKTGCTGWGHCCRYDDARAATPTEADSLAADDLRALCARFRDFQGDSLLLALLAYNVGVKAVKTSSLMDSLSFDAYTSFCYIKGKRSERQYQRRRAEWMLFKAP